MFRKGITPGPGGLMSTKLGWDDLVLPGPLRDELRQLAAQMPTGDEQRPLRQYGRNPWKGSQLYFFGPSGSGKTLAAQLIARELDRPIWRVPSAELLGRFIGETEKNVERLFERVRQSGWVLFFDEADALLGRRTEITSDHARHATIEMPFLLQHAEAYRAPVILSSTARTGPGGHARRRLAAVIEFPAPERR